MPTFTYKGDTPTALLGGYLVKKGEPFVIEDDKQIALARELSDLYSEGTPEEKPAKRNAKS